MKQRFIVVGISRSDCDYEYIDEFPVQKMAEKFIKEHKNEYLKKGLDLDIMLVTVSVTFLKRRNNG